MELGFPPVQEQILPAFSLRRARLLFPVAADAPIVAKGVIEERNEKMKSGHLVRARTIDSAKYLSLFLIAAAASYSLTHSLSLFSFIYYGRHTQALPTVHEACFFSLLLNNKGDRFYILCSL